MPNTRVPEDIKFLVMHPTSDETETPSIVRNKAGEPVSLDRYVAPQSSTAAEKTAAPKEESLWTKLLQWIGSSKESDSPQASNTIKPTTNNGRGPGDTQSVSWDCYNRPGGSTRCYKE